MGKWCVIDFFNTVSSLEDIVDNQLELELDSGRGKHPKWVSLTADENFKKEMKQYILDNGYRKGQPNLTLQNLFSWIKETKDVDICMSTVSIWLHNLGFSYKQFIKGVYFDGHEREDVVESRKLYLELMESFRPRMWVSQSPCCSPECHPIICVFPDESTFYADSDQTFHWTDGSRQALKQKSLGQAIMVSDFIEEVGGFLKHDGQEAWLLLEHQSDGYFTNDMLVKQVERTINIFEAKYPDAQGLFFWPCALAHEDAWRLLERRPHERQRWRKATLHERDYVEGMCTADGHWQGSTERNENCWRREA